MNTQHQNHVVRSPGAVTSAAVVSWRNIFFKPVKNDQGAVLVIAVMLLAILTVLGIVGLNTTTTEIRISGNDKVYKQAFYNAEAGISYAVEKGPSLFPAGGVNAPIVSPADLAAAAPNTSLVYTDKGGSPRRVEVRSTGVATGGGTSVIIAGIVAVTPGGQNPPGSTPTGY
jgi:hypothetical protein